MRVRVSAAAVVDLAGLVDFHESKEPGLGSRIYDVFLKNLRYGTEFPQIGPAYFRDLRKLRLHPFKVWLIYRVFPTYIQVVALVDARRNPKAIRKQLRDR